MIHEYLIYILYYMYLENYKYINLFGVLDNSTWILWVIEDTSVKKWGQVMESNQSFYLEYKIVFDVSLDLFLYINHW